MNILSATNEHDGQIHCAFEISISPSVTSDNDETTRLRTSQFMNDLLSEIANGEMILETQRTSCILTTEIKTARTSPILINCDTFIGLTRCSSQSAAILNE